MIPRPLQDGGGGDGDCNDVVLLPRHPENSVVVSRQVYSSIVVIDFDFFFALISVHCGIVTFWMMMMMKKRKRMRLMVTTSPLKKRTIVAKKESFGGGEEHQRGVIIGAMWIHDNNIGHNDS